MNGGTAEFPAVRNQEGARMVARTASFVLARAVRELFDGAETRITASISQNLYGEIRWKRRLTAGDVQALEGRMREIAGLNEPFEPVRMEAREARAALLSEGRPDAAGLIRDGGTFEGYRCGGVLDTFYGPLAPSTGALKLFSLRYHPPGLLLMLPTAFYPDRLPPFAEMPKLTAVHREAADFTAHLGVPLVADLNAAIRQGRARDIVRVCETWQDLGIARIAELVSRERRRVILIAGPSASGKTTFTRRLIVHLNACGMSPLPLSLDDYYLDRNACPQSPDGTIDVESVDALDVTLFEEQVSSLLAGRTVDPAKFDFLTGRSGTSGVPVNLPAGQPLIIEGINGLNERLSRNIPSGVKYRVFASALAQPNVDWHNRVSTTDLRLLRRLARDSLFRGRAAAQTIADWPGVHAAEFRNIFPLQESADAVFNSALAYELSALRPVALPLLDAVPAGHPSRAEADRLGALLSLVEPLPCPDEIPPTSILREFIGGCTFYQ